MNNNFIPENDLEISLIEASKDVNHRNKFYKLFLESEIFVLLNKESVIEEEQFISGQNTAVEFIACQIKGKSCLPIFSSLTRLRTYIGNRKMVYMKIRARDLFESMDQGLTVMMNLDSAYGKEFTPVEIKKLLLF